MKDQHEMKVLDLAPTQVYPPITGGCIRIFELGKYIAQQGIDFEILSMIGTFKKKKNLEINKNFRVTEFKPYFTTALHLTSTRGIFPYNLSLFYSKKLLKIFLKQGYDIYQFEFPWLTSLYEEIPRDKTKIFVAHNVEFDWYQNEINRTLFPQYYSNRIKKIEEYALKNCDKVISVSNADKNRFIKFYGIEENKIEVIPNGYDGEKFKKAYNAAQLKEKFGLTDSHKIVVFVGSNYYPNQEALKLIIHRIIPYVKDKNIIFLIVGRVGKDFQKFSSKNIRIVGQVNDIVPYFKMSDVAVNPIISGSGSNLKVLEYLAAGLPIISTPFGMRGFEDLKDCATISDIKDFPEHIMKEKVFNKKAFNKLKRYEWTSISKEMQSVYYKLLREK